jgi:hypothetical protein
MFALRRVITIEIVAPPAKNGTADSTYTALISAMFEGV